MATVTELVTKFSFQGSSQPLESYNQRLGSSIGLLGGMTAALGAVGAALRKFTTDALNAVDPLVKMETHTQVSTQAIREWGFIAEQTGSSSDALQSSVQSLSQQISEAALTGSEDFARLGISIRDSNGQIRDAGDVLMETRRRFQQMDLSLAESQNLAETIGIDRSLVQMLRLSSDEFQALRQQARQYGVISEENADQIRDYNNAQRELEFGMQSIRTLVAIGLAPTMQRANSTMAEWLSTHKDLIVGGVQWLGEWIGNLMGALMRLWPTILGLIGVFALFKLSAIGLGTVLGFLLSPIVVMTAGILALLLIVDDLIVAFKGGKSVIADFFEEFFGVDIRPIMQDVVDDFKWAVDDIQDFVSSQDNPFNRLFEASADFLSDQNNPINRWFEDEFLPAFRDLAQMFGTWLSNSIMGALPDWMVNIIRSQQRANQETEDFMEALEESNRERRRQIRAGEVEPEGFMQSLGRVANALGLGFSSEHRSSFGFNDEDRAGRRSGSGGPVTQNNNITIMSPDAEGAGRAVDRHLQRQLRDTDQHFRRGGR